MKIIQGFLILFMTTFGMAATVHAASVTNVAFGKAVTLEDGAFFTGGWGSGQTVNSQTVVDGIFFPKNRQWDQGPVWWDDRDGVANHLVIDLGGTFTLESFVIQADDNDAYLLEYWNPDTAVWQTAWNLPNYNNLGWGMQTRPNVYNNLERYTLGSTITTDALRFSGNLGNSDRLFSVSEIQAFGHASPVPLPAAVWLFGSGLIGLGLFRRKDASAEQ